MKLSHIRIPYWQLLIIPPLLWVLGYAMNVTAIVSNHGYMPVQGYTECVAHAGEERGDYIHVCLDKTARMKIFCDWIYTPIGTASLGDVFLMAGEFSAMLFGAFWVAFVIKDHSLREREKNVFRRNSW